MRLWFIQEKHISCFCYSIKRCYSKRIDLIKNEFVTVKVYNILGKDVLSLINEVKQQGFHNVEIDESALSSGVYLYRISTPSFTQTCKMMVMKQGNLLKMI